MQAPGSASRLRIYAGERDHWHGHPLPNAILKAALERGLAGATVLRGTLGYGGRHRVHAEHPFSVSPDLPVLIEVVDTPERIEAFLPLVQAMLRDGALITVDTVRVVLWRKGGGNLHAPIAPTPNG